MPHTDRVKWKNKCILLAKKLVRLESKGICERCGKYTSVIHGAHVESVRHEMTCADTENIIALCFHCHFEFWHKYPMEASEWFKSKWPGRYERLRERAQQNPDYSVEDWKSIYQYLDSRLKNTTL